MESVRREGNTEDIRELTQFRGHGRLEGRACPHLQEMVAQGTASDHHQLFTYPCLVFHQAVNNRDSFAW